MYKILVVDDSALMRRIVCDIINSDSDFRVVDVSADGEDAYNKIKNNPYDLVVLDMVLPRLTAVELIEKLFAEKVPFNIVLMSSTLKEDAESTTRALELGALDFVLKPIRSGNDTRDAFGASLIKALHDAIKSSNYKTIAKKDVSYSAKSIEDSKKTTQEKMEMVRNKLMAAKLGSGNAQTEPVKEEPKPVEKKVEKQQEQPAAPKSSPAAKGTKGRKLVALACSTGGPQALHTFVPMLPKDLSVPVVIVQHMPEGFTASLATRLNQISSVNVKEAEDGEFFRPGFVYITPGGKHMEICEDASHAAYCHLDDGPPVNSLKPCADIMYKSLKNSGFDEIICVVLTGMGADGSAGIKFLNQFKKTYVISQEASTCVVYGMPKAVEQEGLADEVVPLKSVANSIVKRLGG
ncbi:MAG: chemotaxis-specific protein-glutamate methyltransferase CheB [Pseudobutyrivibrio sp.]|nr:chemotaxis-specific protein-glutamate methyltransferase CheB [Pseudobutyrivibrio sp.]